MKIRGLGRTLAATAMVALFLFPLYWMFNASLQPSGALLAPSPALFPVRPTFDGYRTAVATQQGHLLSSLIVALGTVATSLVVATPAAYALAQIRVRGASAILFVLLIVQMIPGVVMANSLYTIFSRLGLIDHYMWIILVDSSATIPFAILLLRSSMQGIPRELSEAARVDGAGSLRIFVSIIVPVSRNAIITAGLFSFLFAWADFLFAITLTTGQTLEPVTVGIYRFLGNQSADWNGIMATAALASIPAAVLLVAAQRYIAAGVTSGAVKD